jgi:hypothetical protein
MKLFDRLSSSKGSLTMIWLLTLMLSTALTAAADDYMIVLDVGSSHTSAVLYVLDWLEGMEDTNAIPTQIHECYLVSILLHKLIFLGLLIRKDGFFKEPGIDSFLPDEVDDYLSPCYPDLVDKLEEASQGSKMPSETRIFAGEPQRTVITKYKSGASMMQNVVQELLEDFVFSA